MPREKTRFRHVNKDGKVCKVTRENGILYIGNSDVPVGRKFKHWKQFNSLRYSVSTVEYNSWWQENNLNGGFAYNGVTDDF